MGEGGGGGCVDGINDRTINPILMRMTLDERGQLWLRFDVYIIHVGQRVWA